MTRQQCGSYGYSGADDSLLLLARFRLTEVKTWLKRELKTYERLCRLIVGLL